MNKKYEQKWLCLLFAMLLSIGTAAAQSRTVRGTVTSSEDGSPVIGASVLVKGLTVGNITNIDGEFTIENVPASATTLVVSYIGMITQDVPIRSGIIRVILQSDTQSLDEVMVVAYGTVKKSAFTGSASIIGAEALKSPSASIDKSLAGQVAGVQVLSSSGQPGSSTSFRIRGSGSLSASNEPLYVIDGVATSSNEYSQLAYEAESSTNVLSSLNPNDIESVTILKDAAAAALYGSRAANGVVVITTKSGKSGKARVNLSARFSWATLPKAYNLLGSDQIYKKLFDAYQASGLSVTEANERTQGTLTHNPYNVAQPLDANGNVVGGAALVVNTDWQDAVFNTAPTQDYNVNVQGGTDKTDYFFSVGYTDQKGIAPGAQFTRSTGKASINTEVTPWFKTGMNLNFSHSVQHTTEAGSAGAAPMYDALALTGAVPLYVVDEQGRPLDADGGIAAQTGKAPAYNFNNPVVLDMNPVALPDMDLQRSKFYRLIASVYAQLTLFKDLELKTTFSPDYTSVDEKRFWNKHHGNGPAYNGRLDMYHNNDLMFTSTNTATYRRLFDNIHNVNVMAGMEYWQSTYETLYAGGRDLLGEMTELSAAAGSMAPASNVTKEVLISYFGRAEYSYADKYNLSLSLRTDGSSMFGDDTKWGTFWSVGGAWRLKQESFLQDATYIDNLKLRASYGTSGNKSGLARLTRDLARYAAQGLWTSDTYYRYSTFAGLAHAQLANADLSWEKQSMFNVGVDFSFQNRYFGSVDYFYKTSDGLLYDFPLALSNGFNSITLNAAKVANSGVELDFGAHIFTGPFSWTASLNASFIRDVIKDLHGNDDVPMTDYQKIWSVGQSQYEFYMPTWAGVDPQTGDALWYRVDNNGNRTTTNVYAQATKERQGRSTPDVYGGFTNNLSYKGFDLSVQLTYAIGGKLYDGLYSNLMHDGAQLGNNMSVDALQAWSAPGQQTNVPRYMLNNATGSNSLSSRFLYDATHFKLRNVTLTYTLPQTLGAFSDIFSQAKVWASVENLVSILPSGYKGYDDLDMYGVQGYLLYPPIPSPRTVSVGFNMTF